MDAKQHAIEPLVSVVMSVYNDIDYLDYAFTSILNQTITDMEVIVFDDCSSDGSREKLCEYAKQDSRIKLILNEHNRGLTKNLNTGLDLATGKYIARMDGDDYSFPDRFEQQLHILETHPDVVLVGSSYYTIDGSGKRYKLDTLDQEPFETAWIGMFAPPLMHPSAMFRRSLISQHNIRYNESYVTSQDFEIWSQMLRVGKSINIVRPLIEYRMHSNNISTTKRHAQQQNARNITKANLTFYFADLATEKDKELDNLLTILYSDETFNSKQFVQAIATLRLLVKHFSQQHQLQPRQIKRIKMISSRWIVKALSKPQRTSPLNKVLSTLSLYPFTGAIALEAVDYVKRRSRVNKEQ